MAQVEVAQRVAQRAAQRAAHHERDIRRTIRKHQDLCEWVEEWRAREGEEEAHTLAAADQNSQKVSQE